MIQIKRRQMIIPKDEKYIGTVNDANVEARTFRIDRYTETRADLSAHTFKLLTEDEKGKKTTVYLDKMVTDEFIDITWTITGEELGTAGVLFAQIKAFDDAGMVRWNSFKAEFLITENLLESEGGGTLTDFERLEAKVNKAIEEIHGSTIKNTKVEDGYLIITFEDGTEKRFYVKGEKGSVGNMTITMLDAGMDPTVTVTGSEDDIEIDLGIPYPSIEYTDLNNLPTINGVEIKGSITAAALGLLRTSDIKDWAKADTKPTYTAAEVGALPASTVIPEAYNDTEIRQMIAGKQPAGDYATRNDINGLASEQYVSNAVSGKADANSLAAVAFSGSYNDLLDKPSKGDNEGGIVIDNIDSVLSSSSENPVQNKAIKAALDEKQDKLATQTAYTTYKGSATKVPRIKTNSLGQVTEISEATITHPTIPSNVSAFTNDAGYLTEHQSLAGYATEQYVTNAISGKADAGDIPTVPTNVSAFTNDAGYLTEHQSLSGLATEEYVTGAVSSKADSASLATVATSGSYNDLSNKPTIPSAVTESTVSGWGFTKNSGTYSKPSTGIPKSDLASAVQTSLGYADAANTAHTIGTASGTKSYSGLTTCNASCRRYGKICSVTVNIASNTQINAGAKTTLFTIPANFRIGVQSDVALFSAGMDGYIIVTFYTDGTVKSNLGTILKGTNYVGVIVYVCA